MKYLLLITILYTPFVWAQSAAQLQAQLGKKQKRMWGATLVSTTSTTVLEADDYRANTNSTLTGIFRYRFSGFNTRILVSGNKDLTGAREDRFTTAFFEISKVVKPLSGDNITTIFQGRVTPPVNDERRFNESHRGAYSGGLLFIITPPNPKFQIIGITRATKNVHEFEINRNFGQNTSASIMNYWGASYFPSSKWELNVNMTNIQGWNYQGDAGENSTFLGQSIGYNYSRNLILTFGHELGGRTYGYDQDNLDLALFDEDKSSVFASLSMNF